MVLSPIFIIPFVINAYSSLGHQGCISMIKLRPSLKVQGVNIEQHFSLTINQSQNCLSKLES
jgi:hypothetical protein